MRLSSSRESGKGMFLQTSDAPSGPQARRGRSLRILVADDDPDTVVTLSTLLRLEGHEVREELGGREALDAEREFGPDVVLLDIGMPQVNGYEVARKLRQRHADTGSRGPLMIAITCYQQPSDRILAQLCGFDHHLGKPFAAEALLALLAPLKI